MRLTILAVPPVIPLIRIDLGMSETEIGILSGLPPVLFALAAVPGSLLISRLGAVADAGNGPAGERRLWRAAVAQPRRLDPAISPPSSWRSACPSCRCRCRRWSRQWLPQRIPFATAVYTNGLLIGETRRGRMVMLPVDPAAGRRKLAARHRLLVAAGGADRRCAIIAFAPRSSEAGGAPPQAGRRWWPDWRDGRIWRLGFMLGSVNASYFSTNAFLPDFLHTPAPRGPDQRRR